MLTTVSFALLTAPATCAVARHDDTVTRERLPAPDLILCSHLLTS